MGRKAEINPSQSELGQERASIRPLNPLEYSWVRLPSQNRPPSPGTWRNVPIPGFFRAIDFKHGVTVSGQRWLITNKLGRRQWRWDNFILPFLSTVNGFKFLVDLKWIDQQVEAAGVIDDAPADVRDMHGRYFG